MKTLRTLAMTMALFFTFLASPSRAEDEVTFDYFYEALEPHGNWVYVNDYGYCWQPFVGQEDEAWRPYTDGYWASTDSGWTWVSEEEFGWATYHYGRWAKLHDLGWIWVPGYVWGPAWVSWRNSVDDDYIGWAPLPPEADFEAEVGFGTWVDSYYDIGPSYYSFVYTRDFCSPRLRSHIIGRDRNVVIINNSFNITRIRFNSGVFNRVYCGGPNIDIINRRSERPVRQFRLERNHDFNADVWRRNRDDDRRYTRTDGDRLIVTSPLVRAFSQNEERPKPRNLKGNFDQARIDRGWDGIGDKKLAESTRERFRKDADRRDDNQKFPDLRPTKPLRPGSMDAEKSQTLLFDRKVIPRNLPNKNDRLPEGVTSPRGDRKTDMPPTAERVDEPSGRPQTGRGNPQEGERPRLPGERNNRENGRENSERGERPQMPGTQIPVNPNRPERRPNTEIDPLKKTDEDRMNEIKRQRQEMQRNQDQQRERVQRELEQNRQRETQQNQEAQRQRDMQRGQDLKRESDQNAALDAQRKMLEQRRQQQQEQQKNRIDQLPQQRERGMDQERKRPEIPRNIEPERRQTPRPIEIERERPQPPRNVEPQRERPQMPRNIPEQNVRPQQQEQRFIPQNQPRNEQRREIPTPSPERQQQQRPTFQPQQQQPRVQQPQQENRERGGRPGGRGERGDKEGKKD